MSSDISKYLESLTLDLGVQTKENVVSRFNVTQNYNRVAMVIGSSRMGVPNLPTLVFSPENFEEIYGKQDYSLERNGSFFHRTVKDILVEAPVLCLNLRGSDDTKDFYNYYEISTDSSKQNSTQKKKPVTSFYDTSQGFWKRNIDQVNSLNDSDNLMIFTNQKERDISLLIIKSRVKGYDIYMDEWYNQDTQLPSYIHPKSYVSDYLIDVICVEGLWTDYSKLSVDKKYSKYFDINGIKARYLSEFLNLPEITLIKQWTGSLIPYFKDKANADFFIQSIINDDINETGLLCAFNTDMYETENYNTSIDMLGENLYTTKNPNIDFLSYKRYLTDFLNTSSQSLDIPGNSFGDFKINNHGRTSVNTECYVYGINTKNLVLSSTSNYIIKPFNYYDSAYYILNGKTVIIPDDISDTIVLPQLLDINTQIVYSLVATMNGIESRLGIKTNIFSAPHYPRIDFTSEFVLCDYIMSCDTSSNYHIILEEVGLTSNGSYDYMNYISFNKINNTTYSYVFNYLNKEVKNIYINEYIKHLEMVFKSYLNVKSIFLNDLGEKIYPRYIVDNQIIFDSNDYTDISNLQMYKIDTEFLDGNNTKPEYSYSKYPLTFKTGKGILGYESFITEKYLSGQINSGDPFFYAYGEYVVDFVFDSILNKNFIVFEYIIPKLENTKIVLNDSTNNNGLYNTLSFIDYNNRYALEVVETVISESVPVSIYDATHPYVINIEQTINGSVAFVEDWTGLPTIMYEKLKQKDDLSIWNKTVEVNRIVDINTIIVDKQRYNDIRIGDLFVAGTNESKVFTRVIDVYHIDENNITVKTDMGLLIENMQAKRVIPLHKWISSYRFIGIEKYLCRPELLPDNTDERLQEILSIISDMTPYLLTDKFEVRYIIDSYGAGLYLESKKELAVLAEKHKFCLSLINMPSKKEFKNDGTKYTTRGMLDISKIVSGGDRINNTGTPFSPYRSSHAVYLTPYVTVYENNRHYKVPPASHIGQLFLKKFNEPGKKANDAVAGLYYNIPTISGLDDIYSLSELNMFEQYGITAITNYANTYYCFNNRTSMVNNTVLRFTHARESMIELELSMYKALLAFQWTSDYDKLLNSVNEVCKYYFEQNIISNYTNSIDETYIDSQILIVNTSVEIDGKLQSLLLRMNILPTGYLSSKVI